MHNDLSPEQPGEIGNERQKIGNWIGTGSSTDGELTSHV